jgi:hypothetical protein
MMPHPQLGEQIRRPTMTRGRVADDDGASRSHERDTEPQRAFRRTEPSSDRGVERCGLGEGELIDVLRADVDTLLEPEAANGPAHEIGPLLAAVDEHDPHVGPVEREHETRDAATGAEVDHRPVHVLERPDERAGVVDDLRDRAVPQRADTLRFAQRVDQFVVGWHVVGEYVAGWHAVSGTANAVDINRG